MEQQLRYYGEFFFEAPVNSFQNAKIAHRTVLEALEKGEIVSPRWEDWDTKRQQVLSRLHRNPTSNNAKPQGTNNNQGKNKSNKPKSLKPTPCDYWNAGTCDNAAAEHPGNHVSWLHICANCFKNNGDRQKHRESACPHPKFAQAKNAKGPAKGQ